MKKILIIVLLGLCYQSTISANTTTIELAKLINGTTVSEVKLENSTISEAKISSITEEQLAAAITTGTKIPLYQMSDIPYGWDESGIAQSLLLSLGGFPNPNGYYIQDTHLYKPDGTILGEYKATLISEATALANGWSCAAVTQGNNLYLRVAEVNGAIDSDSAEDVVLQGLFSLFDYNGGTYIVATESAADPYTTTYTYSNSVKLNAVRQEALGDTYFLQVYIDLAPNQTIPLDNTIIELSKNGDTVTAVKLNSSVTEKNTIKNFTEEQLKTAITDGTKVPLYTLDDVPMGWDPVLGTHTLALAFNGTPNPQACYLQGDRVYDGSGNILGTYFSTLVTTATATAAGAQVAKFNENTLYLRITENKGTNNADTVATLLATFMWTLGIALIDDLTAPNISTYVGFDKANPTQELKSSDASKLNSPLPCYTHSTIPDDIFLQIYIDTSDTNATS